MSSVQQRAPQQRAMSGAEWLMLLGLSVLWGGSYFFVKVAVVDIPPLTIALGRVGIAALAILIVLRIAGIALPRSAALWRAFLVMGLLNNVIPFALSFWAMTEITAGLAAILNASTPLFTVLVAHLFTDNERLTPPRLAGALIGFGGVAIMVGPAALAGLGGDLPEQLACLGGALSFAVAGVYGRRFRDTPPLVTASGQLAAATVIALPLALIVERPWTLPAPGLWPVAAVVTLAVVSSAFAYIVYFRLLKTAGPTNLLLVTLLIPVSALLLGVLILGEALEPQHLAGMVGIALGLALIDGRVLSLARRRAKN